MAAGIESRFSAGAVPVTMTYDVVYRFLGLELADVGQVTVTTTVGTWRHAASGQTIPALLMVTRIDSPDSGRPGERRRVSIHDRIMSVLTVPGLEALVFTRESDLHLNPVIGRSKDVRQVSSYDTQSGQLAFRQDDLVAGSVRTNITNPEVMLDLSRRIGPLMAGLVHQCRDTNVAAAGRAEAARIGVNMDGRAVSLLIKTYPQRSPACLDRQRPASLCLTTEAEPGSGVKPRDFHAWNVPFDRLASWHDDPALAEAVRAAPVESIVPLVLDYELALGSIRATMTSVRAGAAEQRTARSAADAQAAGLL